MTTPAKRPPLPELPLPLRIVLPLMHPKDIARLLDLSVRTLWRMVQRGEFPEPERINRKLVRFAAGEVLAWLDRRGALVPVQGPADADRREAPIPLPRPARISGECRQPRRELGGCLAELEARAAAGLPLLQD
jgi:predicted DNA-binding transcriptional regulator AlpA